MLFTNDLIANSSVAFGTSGARGLVSDFTPEICAAFAIAFANVMQQEGVAKTMALAIDNRPSSYHMAQSISAGLAQKGIKTEFYGVIPTPALAYYAMQQNMPCIMVTGSHIPFDRNGLKFYRPEGEITKADEVAILSKTVGVLPINSLPELSVCDKAASAYILRYTEAFGNNILSGKRIGIYEHSTAGRDIYRYIFEALDAEVISLDRSDEFIPIDTEAVSEDDKQKARDWVKEYKLDALFSTDGDGDRALLSDENGEWLRGDILGLLCSKILGVNALSTPVNCNTAIEKSEFFKIVERTKIGSPYVIEAFSDLTGSYDAVAGFEANGGCFLASEITINGKVIKPLPTRDAILPAIALLSQLRLKPISELINALPKRFTASDRIQEFELEKSLQLIENIGKNSALWLPKLGINTEVRNVDKTDGFRMLFDDGDFVHLRPSGNAPELRCYAESDSQDKAEKLVAATLQLIKLL